MRKGHLIAFHVLAALAGDAGAGERHGISYSLSQFAERRAGSRDGGVVPISVESGEIVVDVIINGKGPFPMMFDTGSAVSWVTPETAVLLGLEVEGGGTVRGSAEGVVLVALARVKEMRLGDAIFLDQSLVVSPLPRFVTDRGDKPSLAGIIGYEVLARFAVRLDYDRRMLTLTPAPDFRYRAAGVSVPLVFADKYPVIPAAVDGVVGRFEIDTGSSSAIVLQRKFVEHSDLEARHPGGLRMKSGGVDGVFETIITRVGSFGVASAKIERPAAEFPGQGKKRFSIERRRRQHRLPNLTTVRYYLRLFSGRSLVRTLARVWSKDGPMEKWLPGRQG